MECSAIELLIQMIMTFACGQSEKCPDRTMKALSRYEEHDMIIASSQNLRSFYVNFESQR
jgi:hypothetical protein